MDDLFCRVMHNVGNSQKFTKLDLRDRAKTTSYIAKIKPEIIFHLAADATVGRSNFTPFSALDRNLVAYFNVLIPAIRHGMRRMILASSMDVYGEQQVPFTESMESRPEDIYGISKDAMEESTKVLSDVHGFKYVIIRPHNVYGPRQNLTDPYRNVIGIFINRLLNGKNFYIYGDGNQMRAFSYIDDVVGPMVRAAFSKKCEGRIINIGGDKAITLNQLANLVLEEFFQNKNIPKRYRPTYVPMRPKEVKNAYSNHSVAEQLIGFNPKTLLKEGIGLMIAWARSVGPQKFVYLPSLELDHKTAPQTWKKKLI